MASLTQFHGFDPVSGYVPEYPFAQLPEVASRARSFLVCRPIAQLELTAKRINSEIESYFSDLKFQAVAELTVKFQNDQETYQDFFQWDASKPEKEQWVYRDEMDEELDIPTAQNSSEVDALKTIIENRDSCFFLPGDPKPEPNHWPEDRTPELFAVLSLKMLGYCIKWTSQGSNSFALSIGGACALEAMEAVCFAEHVREVEWREYFHKRQLFEASAGKDALDGDIREKVRTDLVAEFIAHERAKKMTRSEQMNAARHQATKVTQELVCADWEKATYSFPSAEKAGLHYANWLEEKSIGYQIKGQRVFYQPRAVTGWIRKHAKVIGIKFR